MNRVQDGPQCQGCGLPNYEGLCPHCRGNESGWQEMWGVLEHQFPTADIGDEVLRHDSECSGTEEAGDCMCSPTIWHLTVDGWRER